MKKISKKLGSILLIMAVAVSICACGNDDVETKVNNDVSVSNDSVVTENNDDTSIDETKK